MICLSSIIQSFVYIKYLKWNLNLGVQTEQKITLIKKINNSIMKMRYLIIAFISKNLELLRVINQYR